MRDTLNHIDLGSVSGGDFLERSLFLVSLLVLIVPAGADNQVKR
jgi:hypothetical protein